MGSHGKLETEKLKKNLEAQLDRLVQQLEDIEENRNLLDAAAYEEAMQLTKEDLQEFNESLQRLISGDTTLIDQLGAIQLAIQAAISEAFKTPAVIRMFGKRETSQLRNRLAEIEYDMKLGKITKEVFDLQRAEVLNALRQLGEKLELQELQLLEKLMFNNIDTTNYVQVIENVDKGRIAMAVVGDEARIQNT
ncbi:protein LZIC [Apis mellifera caucasica]|uniref:Protein LZIC n=1 Tax=Apis mellifera TaxID=7460 RepID=A0A7M7RAN4_APIME|nr:protein LZIC [Apis mellifera]KAG6796697.1 protein LZIC [Apis mellifera caucasica]KAG9436463.1 protein LZIC [Apis mellifera carnica]|eukprot:XP_624541.1 protein LZIC [Apis mellifera]